MRRIFFLVGLLAVAILILFPPSASAHAALAESDPPINTVIAAPPATARLRFTEPLEATYSRVVLASADGPVSTDQSRVDPNDEYVLLLDLPALPEGQYVLQWRTLSQADGHTLQGAIPFAIGDPSAATAPVVLPPPPPDPLVAPPLSDVLLRWLTVLSLAIAVGSLVSGLFVWQDRFAADDQRLTQFERQFGRLVLIAASFAVIATFGTLIAASMRAETNLFSFIISSRVGSILAARLLITIALLTVIAIKPQRWHIWALGLGAAALLTVSLISHSAVARDATTGTAITTAIAIGFDWMHLLATSAWIGALPALLPAAMAVRRGAVGGRGTAGTLLVSRFTAVATASIIVLAATGTFAALQHIGAISELWTTTYGRALLIKLGLFGVLLLLGAYNRWWVEPYLASTADDPIAQTTGLRRLRRSVLAEVGVSALLLVAVGVLTSSAPARDAGTGTADFAETVTINNAALSLQVVRGDIAGDTFALDVRGLPADAEPTVVLRTSMPTHDMGEQEVALEEIEPGRWGARSVVLTMPGAWNVEAIVRAPGMNDLRHTFIVDTATETATNEASSAPIWALLLVCAAIVAALSQLPLRRPWRSRLQTGTLGLIAAAFVATTIPYYFARATEAGNPLPQTAETLAAGQAVYQQNCVGCHGVTGRGDGPAAQSLPGLPGDFTQAHFATHTDAKLYEWIRGGKPGTAMPAFGEKLNDEQVWQVISYIRSIYQNAQTASR